MKYNNMLVDGTEIIREITSDARYTGLKGRYALHIVLTGEAAYTIQKRQITLVPGSFILLNPDTCYTQKIDSSVEVETMTILLDPQFVYDFECSGLFKDYFGPDAEKFKRRGLRFVESIYPLEGNIKFNLSQLIRQLDSEVTDASLLKEYLTHLLLDYYELYDTEVIKREASLQFLNGGTKTEIMKRLSVARDYMISNYKKRIQLDEIAQTACLSVNHLLRTFKQAYQQSPHQFLTSVRLQQAKYLLRNTNYPVGEIVDIIGFECPSSFIRLFRNSFNVTPGQYR